MPVVVRSWLPAVHCSSCDCLSTLVKLLLKHNYQWVHVLRLLPLQRNKSHSCATLVLCLFISGFQMKYGSMCTRLRSASVLLFILGAAAGIINSPLSLFCHSVGRETDFKSKHTNLQLNSRIKRSCFMSLVLKLTCIKTTCQKFDYQIGTATQK